MSTGKERDGVVLALAESTLEQPAAERESFLRSACGNDPALFEEVSTCIRELSQAGTDPVPTAAQDEFAAGTVLADRFRIIRRVGAGGMGMVYEALDQTLDRRVAIKCAKAGHGKSLPPEARTAREVSHYNVCKVYDLHIVTTDSGEVDFLSMEFVEGETLAKRIQRGGPLPPKEALGIARQICAGLAQAHRQGVIHGDLKLGNVILAKAADGGTRAVITDFGLARFAQPDSSSIRSRQGGTLDYMSPELLLGESATIASDVYALGVLFHAMLTGRSPKRSGTEPVGLRKTPSPQAAVGPEASTVTMAVRIVDTEWQRQVEALPRPWRRVIGKCLEPKAERRFGTARLVGDALEPRRTFLKWGTAAAVVVAAGLGYWQWHEPPPGQAVRLAVLPFHVDRIPGTEASAVALDIADRLNGARRNFSVITPIAAQQNQVDTPEKARTVLGATHALQTNLSGAQGQIAADARLIDLESGQTVRTLQSTYAAGDTATLAKALIGTVTLGFNLKLRSAQEPVADAAYPYYIQGLNVLRQDIRKANDAVPLLEKAIALDSRSALPYAALAAAQIQKYRNGDGPQCLERAAEAAGKAAGINPDSVQVLLASGQVDQFKGRYEPAVLAFQRASTLDPGNSEVWQRLAEAYALAGRDEDVVSTYRRAIAASPGGYVSYLLLGNFYWSRGQYQQAEEMYRKTTSLAPGLVSGHMNLGLALKSQGRYQESEQSLLKALALTPVPSARLLLNIGALYYEEERYPEALSNFQESARQGPPTAALQRNLGDAYRHLSRAPEAAEAYRTAQAMSEQEVSMNPRSAAARARLALVSARLGDTHRATYELSQVPSMEPGNTVAIFDAVQAFEVLKLRDKAIQILQQAPRSLLEGLSRLPDLTELRQDPRFQQLLQRP